MSTGGFGVKCDSTSWVNTPPLLANNVAESKLFLESIVHRSFLAFSSYSDGGFPAQIRQLVLGVLLFEVCVVLGLHFDVRLLREPVRLYIVICFRCSPRLLVLTWLDGFVWDALVSCGVIL